MKNNLKKRNFFVKNTVTPRPRKWQNLSKIMVICLIASYISKAFYVVPTVVSSIFPVKK